MSDDEETRIPVLRWWLSYGGTGVFFVLAMAVIWRGSIKIPWAQHRKITKYWERVFATIHCFFIVCVQIGTFTTREIWDISRGPDDAWEILWGMMGLCASALCLCALLSRQYYRLHLHHALLVHGSFCALCIADLILRDNMSWHAGPMMVCAVNMQWMISVAPRVFQITGHTSSSAENQDEKLLLMFGTRFRFEMASLEDLEKMRYEALSYFARGFFWCKNCFRRQNAREISGESD